MLMEIPAYVRIPIRLMKCDIPFAPVILIIHTESPDTRKLQFSARGNYFIQINHHSTNVS